MATFIQDGRHLDHTPGTAVASGQVVILDAASNYVGIAARNIAANELGALDTEGVWQMAKAVGGDAFTHGQPVTIAAGAGGGGEITAAAAGPHRVIGAVAAGNLLPKVAINVR